MSEQNTMDLATIKDITLHDDELTKVIKSKDFSAYETLASTGYAPARYVAPVKHGYSIINLDEVRESLAHVGDDPNPRNVKKYAVSPFLKPDALEKFNADWRAYSKAKERRSAAMNKRPRFGYLDYEDDMGMIPVSYDSHLYYDDRYEIAEPDGRSNIQYEIFGEVLRKDPRTGLEVFIGIKIEKLKNYKGLIPPENAANIEKALKSGLFDYVEIWSPNEPRVLDKDEKKRMEGEVKYQLIDDPIAVGFVVTGKEKCEACEYKTGLVVEHVDCWGHRCEKRVPYFIDAWAEDVVLGEKLSWLLQG